MSLNKNLSLRKQWFYPLALFAVITLSTAVFSYNQGARGFRRVRLAFPEDLLSSCTDALMLACAQQRRLP